MTDHVPNARPGTRAPHVWLDHNGERISTLDLFGHEWVLLAGKAGDAWREAARIVGDLLNVPFQAGSVGVEGEFRDSCQAWSSAYGVDDDGAVLIRPDGHVAWRSPGAVPDATLELTNVLAQLLGRVGPQR